MRSLRRCHQQRREEGKAAPTRFCFLSHTFDCCLFILASSWQLRPAYPVRASLPTIPDDNAASPASPVLPLLLPAFLLRWSGRGSCRSGVSHRCSVRRGGKKANNSKIDMIPCRNTHFMCWERLLLLLSPLMCKTEKRWRHVSSDIIRF